MITVTNHAQRRYRQRFNLWDLTDEVVINVLETLLRDAMDKNRVASHKPVRFRVWGDNGGLKKGQQIAWSADERVAVIFSQDAEDEYTIVTCLSRAASKKLTPANLERRGRA